MSATCPGTWRHCETSHIWTGPARRTATRGRLRHLERSHNRSTISLDQIDHQIREKPVDPAAATALRALHQSGINLLLASNTLPCEMRWPALQQAGIDDLFRAALLSYPLGVRKPDPFFYDLVLAAAGCPARQVLFVGDNLDCDVAAPAAHGMRAALVRPHGLRPGEMLPAGALLIHHVQELPALLEAA